MPCTITGTLEGDRILSLEESLKKATEATQLLCLLCAAVDEHNGAASTRAEQIEMPEEVYEWWIEHKEQDRTRKLLEEKERQRRIAQLEQKLADVRSDLRALKEPRT